MRTQKIYQVDAFTDKLFSGNPAAVCPLDSWPDDVVLQNIARENNLSETAFYVRKQDLYEIRWFTPATEVNLCGHATLATAYVLFCLEKAEESHIRFHSPRSGELQVRREEPYLVLNFPADPPQPVPLTDEFADCFDITPVACLKGKADFVLVLENEEQVRDVRPNLSRIAGLDGEGVIITAPGRRTDFVSRFFAPQLGIDEDPVTGSAHTVLIPYWANRLGKNEMTAVQLSGRKGFLQCRYLNPRVEIGGQAVLYLTGELFL